MRELSREFGLSTALTHTVSTLSNFFATALSQHRPIVMVCIGTDRVLGDCFGPIMGDKLINKGLPIYIYGSTLSNVNARNINSTLHLIHLVHPDAVVLAIDALSTTDPTAIGDVIISDQYIGLCNNVKIFADLYVYGVSTYLSPVRHNILSRLNIINRLSDSLASAIQNSISRATHIHSLSFLENILDAKISCC